MLWTSSVRMTLGMCFISRHRALMTSPFLHASVKNRFSNPTKEQEG